MIILNRLIDDIKMFAQLLQSVGRQGTGPNQTRPLKPVECAKMISRLIEEGDTLPKVAERLNLGKPKDKSNIYKKRDITQVKDFINLLKVSEKSIDFAGWGYEGHPKIPFSVLSQLAFLHDNPEDQDMIIQSVFNPENKKRTIGKEDIKKIRKWRNENKDLPIKVCIEKILALKPTKTVTHMVVSAMRPKLKQFVISNPNFREKLLTILQNSIDGEFHDIYASNTLITISMDKSAYKEFYDQQYKRGVPFTQFLNELLEDKIE